MKRRDFLKTSVGAGLAYGMFPLDSLAQRRSGGKTMYDKIWDEHEVTHLGGITSILHVDRLLIADGGPEIIHNLVARGGKIRNPQLVWTVIDHSVSTSPDRYTNRSLRRLRR
jgi:homoaconitase/3-isopropylmalate dehydratase large subunit